MTQKLYRSLLGKAGKEYWLLSLDRQQIENILFYLLLLFLPTQFGKHFWPSFSYVFGIRVDYLSVVVYTADILILLILIFTLVTGRARYIFKIKKTLVFFLLLLLIRGLLSPFPLNSLWGFVKVIECAFLISYIARRAFTKKEYAAITLILIISLFIESSIAVFQFINGGSIGGLLYYLGERTYSGVTPGIANASVFGRLALRPYATFSHPNVLAGYILICLELITLLVLQKKLSYNKFFLLAIIFIGFIVLLFTMSRIVILTSFFLIFVLALKSNFSKKLKIAGACIFFAGIGFILYQYSFLLERFFFSFSDEAFVFRERLVDSSLAMIKDNFLFGVGIHNFLPNVPLYLSKTIFLLIQPVHNIFLYVFSEIGFVGSILFLTLILPLFKKFSRSFSSRSFFIPLLTILFLGLFDHYFVTLSQGQLLFSFVLGLCYNKDIK